MSETTAEKLVKFYDGAVFIRGPEGEYLDSFDNYALDAGKPPPPLPGKAIGRSYIPGELHNLSDGVSDKPQVQPWPPGDKILVDLQFLLDNQVTRRQTEVPDESFDINNLRIIALDALFDATIVEGTPPQEVIDYVNARDAARNA